jgi:adenine-specific DNA-methyltransferase
MATERARYQDAAPAKASGATYTPPALAAYLAARLVDAAAPLLDPRGQCEIVVLDPAAGTGILLAALLDRVPAPARPRLVVHAFDTDGAALAAAGHHLASTFPGVTVHTHHEDFLAAAAPGISGARRYHLILANPPWVRAQVLGSGPARAIARRFGLRGRIDLGHAFVLAMIDALADRGALGVVLSNRFMTTRAGAPLRRALRERLHLHRVWDLGDTRLFSASVLPALLVGGAAPLAPGAQASFTAAYATAAATGDTVPDVVDLLDRSGRFRLPDGRVFEVDQGSLGAAPDPAAVFRLANPAVDAWLAAVRARTWGTFASIGKVRVGVKTTADRVFIRTDWHQMPDAERPELLRPLLTHHVARRYRSEAPSRQILYPHVAEAGERRAANLAEHPRAAAYLLQHRAALEARPYLRAAGRRWYELWVSHDPAAWRGLKLVFRDIAARPTFFLDDAGCVVNGDCYWLAAASPDREPLLWLAVAVACSTFIERFYDHLFHNKLYGGRRRFITQYVEQFPLPDPEAPGSREIIARARERFAATDAAEAARIEVEIDELVLRAFGV